MGLASKPSTAHFRPARRDALRVGGRAVVAMAGLGLLRPAGAAQPSKRVLIIHSFGRDFAPYDAVIATFRREIASRAAEPVVFLEAALDAGRAMVGVEVATFAAYLEARFANPRPDLIVGVGPPAAQFVIRHREALFPGVPMLLTAIDARFVPRAALNRGDVVVATQLDVTRALDTILRVLPQTQTIAMVLGATPLERYWRKEAEREVAALSDRVQFVWFDDLSLAQMKERVAALPPHSAVFYGLLVADAAGIPHERLEALAELRRASTAPIFSLFENELGLGVVGGPYLAQSRAGREAAQAALRSLAAPGEPVFTTIAMENPVYDRRELQRWRIDASRLPPGSEIRFEPPSIWQEHRVAVIATATALLLQATLLVGLLLQRERRRRAEREAQGLAGRLVTAHEDERRRLARELHDDVTQRLAGLAIEASRLEHGASNTSHRETAHSIREGLVELGEDIHALSYRLHPSVIEDLGLVEALRIECERIAQQGPLRVSFDCHGVPKHMSADAALCLFRVAQEALHNVERHAQANNVEVSVMEKDEGVALAVRDNGSGFNMSSAPKRASLGLASMRERIRVLGGRLDIQSTPGSGTSLSAWVPLRLST
jgi:signal transduction histidine kinase